MSISPLKDFIQKYQPNITAVDLPFIMEFVLWALVEFKQLSKSKTADGMSFNDLYNKLLGGL
jgi:magnesium chelatase subunit I